MTRPGKLVVLAAVLAVLLGGLWAMFSHRGSQDALREEPARALEAFISAQEKGDLEGVTPFVLSSARDRFLESAQNLTRDELIQAGLTFRQEGYRLEEVREGTATFYSPRSALYLAMRREDGQWRIDPDRTDRLNREK